MTDTKLKYAISDLEYCLSVHLRPSFLIIVEPENNINEIHVVISCSQFKYKNIETRIATIFQLLSRYCFGIMDEYLIVFQALDSLEIEEYLDNVFSEELR